MNDAEKCLESCNDHDCVVSGSCKGVAAAPKTTTVSAELESTCQRSHPHVDEAMKLLAACLPQNGEAPK